MMDWEYFTHFHKSTLCYTDVHVYRATSLQQHLFCTFFGEMTSWPVQYDIIYHFSIFEDLRGLTALRGGPFCVQGLRRPTWRVSMVF